MSACSLTLKCGDYNSVHGKHVEMQSAITAICIHRYFDIALTESVFAVKTF